MNGHRFNAYLLAALAAIAILAAGCGSSDDDALRTISDEQTTDSDDGDTSPGEDPSASETQTDSAAQDDGATDESDEPGTADNGSAASADDDSTTSEDDTDSAEADPAGSSVPCLIRLHGKGGDGGSDSVYQNDIKQLTPRGNDEAWDGYQWLYFPEDRYQETVLILNATVEEGGCTDVVLNGFSNGAAFAGKLFCQGEDLGGRLRGVVIDDPVPDNGTAGCSPAAGVEKALYWTGALAGPAPAGADCVSIDWTCEGGTSAGIDQYAQDMGADVQASPFSDHQWYWDAPEILSFFG